MRKGQERFPLKISEGNVTVTVYRQDRRQSGKGVSYLVADHSAGPRRLRAFQDLASAKDEAARLARLISTGQTHAATFTNSDAASFGRALMLLDGTGVTLEAATAIFSEAVKLVGSPALLVDAARLYAEVHAGVTARGVSDAVADYLRTKESHQASRRYLEDIRYRLGALASAFHCDVDAVSTAVLQAWFDRQKLSPQSIRNFRTVLSGFFSFAKARGWCASSPAEGLVVPKVKTDAEPEIFTARELASLLKAASPAFLPCVVFGALAGLRSAETERIHWQDVDLGSGEIVIRRGTAKTRSRRIIPLCPAAKAWLLPYAGRKGPVWHGGHDAFYGAQETCAAAAGIVWKANGLRHGYASHRLAETGDAVRVAHELGNSAEVVHRHYKSLVPRSEATAWFGIFPERPANVLEISRRAVA